jgi:predicted RND superfamily exporter protein
VPADPTETPIRGLRGALDLLARLVLAHRGLFLLGLVLVSAGAAYGGLRLRADFTVQELFATDDPDTAFLKTFKEQFGADDDLVVLLLEADDVFRPEVLRAVARLTHRMRALEAVRHVESLTTLPDLGDDGAGAVDTRALFGRIPDDPAGIAPLRRRALRSHLLRGRVVSADARLTAVVANLAPGAQRDRENQLAVKRIRAAAAAVELPPGVRLHLAGVPVVRQEAVRMLIDDQLRFLPLGSALIGLLLFWLYRRLHGVLIPLVSVLLSSGYTVALMGFLDLPLDILSNVLPLLVMVYGVADAVHLLGRMHEELGRRQQRELALRVALRHLGVACLLTSATTAIGFGSLTTATMRILRRFGLLAAGGVMVAYLVTMVVVPLGLAWLRPRPGPDGRPRPPARTLRALDRALARVAALAVRRPRSLFAGGLLLGLGGAALGTGVKVDNYLLGIYREDHPMVQATRLAEQNLEGVVVMEVSIRGRPGSAALKDPRVLSAMARLQRWLERQPGVTGTLSLADIVMELHRAVVGTRAFPKDARGVAQLLLMAEDDGRLERLVDYPYEWGRIHVSLRDIGAVRYLELARRARARVAGLQLSRLGVQARVSGTSLIAYRAINRLSRDMLVSLSVALAVIAVVLMLLFRSPQVGLMSLLPNAIPLAVGVGFMRLAGLRLEPVTVMVYSIALGIAVDDTIHFLVRYREELRRGADAAGAVRATLRTAGRAMVFTSALLIGGFSVTLISNFPGTVRFGQLGMVILATALVTDLLVTPACCLLFRPFEQKSP